MNRRGRCQGSIAPLAQITAPAVRFSWRSLKIFFILVSTLISRLRRCQRQAQFQSWSVRVSFPGTLVSRMDSSFGPSVGNSGNSNARRSLKPTGKMRSRCCGTPLGDGLRRKFAAVCHPPLRDKASRWRRTLRPSAARTRSSFGMAHSPCQNGQKVYRLSARLNRNRVTGNHTSPCRRPPSQRWILASSRTLSFARSSIKISSPDFSPGLGL